MLGSLVASARKAIGKSGGSAGGLPPGSSGRPAPSGGSPSGPRLADARSEPASGETVSEEVTATVVTLNRVRTAETSSADETAWVEGGDGHTEPDGFPIKVNTRSGIYHEPGGRVYERTNADRWYRSTAAAEADGFRASKMT